MARKPKEVPQRALIDDCSSVVLHARQTTFVMLIISALVAVGILAEDVARLNRAVDDAEIVKGSMNLWRTETRDKDGPVSVPHILAGPAPEASDAAGTFRLGLAPSGDSKGDAVIACRVDLDLSQRFFVPEKGPVRKILVRPSDKFESGSEINVERRNISGESLWTEWSLKQPPHNLKSYSRFWDMLVSSGGSARIDTADIERDLAQGISAFDQGITIETAPTSATMAGYWVVHGNPNFKVAHVKMLSGDSQFGKKETAIAPVGTYMRLADWTDDAQPLDIYVLRATDWNERIEEWKSDEFDTAALSLCRGNSGAESILYPVVFPVKLRMERFDWTAAWLDRAIDQGHLSKEVRPKLSSKLRLPFAQAFADLHREAEGLESIELDALHDWLRGRLDREGKNIEVAGIGMPRSLLRSLGLFLILVLQGYAALHLSEAAFRMKSSAEGDPGAFQAWIVLYDGLPALCAALGIVLAPTAAALTVMWVLHEGGGFWTPYVLASGAALVVSLMLATYSARNVVRLRTEAQRHRESAARYRADQNPVEAEPEPLGSGHGSQASTPTD